MSARLHGCARSEIARRSRDRRFAPVKDELVRSLVTAADQFIVARGEQKTVIAGYHWFSDWGRDTMIALPGLTLVTGRFEIARSILLEFSRHVDQGMLPNRFPDAGEQPEYNTVDATLWFFEAIRAYAGLHRRLRFVRKHLYDVLTDIIAWHVRGTRYGIRVDDGGLLASGAPGVQLTWMDAKVGDWVVTPRYGKPVEIQALWYNALRTMEDLPPRFGDSAAQKRYVKMADGSALELQSPVLERKCRMSLRRGERRASGCIDAAQPDPGRQPATQHASARTRPAVVEVVARELLTRYGLRTLSAQRPALYRPLRRRPARARYRLPPGHGVALADGAVSLGIYQGSRRDG